MSSQGATTMPPSDPSAALDSMNSFMGNLEKTLGRALKPLQTISKQMGGSKFGKNVKALGGALKGMAGASVNAWAMEQLFKLIEPFMKLLELLEIPINVISALLTVMVNEIFVQLLPYIMVLTQYLITLMPYFKILGEWMGKYIIIGIQKLIEWIIIAYKWIKEVIPLVKAFFMGMYKGITDFKNKVVGIWQGIFGPEGFIATGIRKLFNIVKNIINGILSNVNGVIIDINTVIGTSVPTIPLLREGGFTTGEGLAYLHKNEFVVPLDKGPQMGKDPALLAEMEEQNRLLGRMYRLQKERAEWQL